MREIASRSFAPLRSLLPASAAERATYDGLTAFAPIWAIATLFSIAGDRSDILFRGGLFPSVVTWATIGAAVLLILRPRATSLLLAVSALMLTRYAMHMPVASNNKMISAFMNAGVLIIAIQAYVTIGHGEPIREMLYERMRVVGRALLAVMYFYGIFHKINTDFLDPSVSCASRCTRRSPAASDSATASSANTWRSGRRSSSKRSRSLRCTGSAISRSV